MAIADLTDWMEEQSAPHVIWYAKRLAANDTLASGGHQAGPYIPKSFLFDMFPSLLQRESKNPDKWFELRLDSHSGARQVRAIWYNNKFHGGTRDETRLTNFGGAESALLDPDNTGALAVFAFHRLPVSDATVCHAWVCDSAMEADLVEDRIGPVEPLKPRIWSLDEKEQEKLMRAQTAQKCWLEPHEIPPQWLTQFPSGAEIIRKTIERRPAYGRLPPDNRLMKRRECEFEMFRSLEQAVELPLIKLGYETIDEFLARAQTILQRRKSRAGRSLELHAREIFLEENLKEGQDFQHQPESDKGQRPDFLFPSQLAYKDALFPAAHLRMLAVKTTCKDRWRQILSEADRVPIKHLLTLQEGVSDNQFQEMTRAGVKLVVPSPLIQSYPESIRPHIQTFESFIGDIRIIPH